MSSCPGTLLFNRRLRYTAFAERLRLVKGERIITDGTLIEANASIDSMVSRDHTECDKTEYRKDVTAPLPSRKISNKTHISKTDPDSSLAKKEGTPRSLKYKAHISIDADSRVVLDSV